MESNESPIVGLHDLAQLVGYNHARKLMHNLHEEAEARKVMEQQEVEKLGRLDQAVDYFYDEECDGRIANIIPPGAYIYWWLRSQEMGGQVGDFWRSPGDVKWFEKKNPEVVVKSRFRNARSGYSQILEGTKYGDVRKEARAA